MSAARQAASPARGNILPTLVMRSLARRTVLAGRGKHRVNPFSVPRTAQGVDGPCSGLRAAELHRRVVDIVGEQSGMNAQIGRAGR